MKKQSNGIGGYKRKTSPNGAVPISEGSRARMDEADRICRERGAAAKAAAAYASEKAGIAEGGFHGAV